MKHYLVYLVTTNKALGKKLVESMRQKGWLVLTFNETRNILPPANNPPDIWIVDITIAGIELIKTIKEALPLTPVLAIAPAKTRVERVIGLEVGSDDYLAKPFLPEEVPLRVKRLLTRGASVTERLQPKLSDSVIQIEPYIINISKRIAIFHDQEITLTSNEFELLLFLAANRGHILTREQILEYIWGQKKPVAKRAVDDLVYHLRIKLRQLPLASYYGSGFRLLY